MSFNFAPWEGATNCTGSVTPGASHLLAWCREAYPQGGSMGIYNCRTVVGGSTTSLHGEGRALDWGMPMVGGRGSPAGHELVRRLGENGQRLGIQAIIYDRQIWSARSPDGRPYTGQHPHYDHLHIELTWNAARNLTLATLRSVLGSSKEWDMIKRGDKGPQVGYFQRRLRECGQIREGKDLLPRFGADRDFGGETEDAVKTVQGYVGFEKTGVIDMATAIYIQALAHSAQHENLGGGSGQDGQDGQDGKDGKDGREVEIRKASGNIQWRYKGGSWTNLVALNDLKGPKGDAGNDADLSDYGIPLIKRDA
jgi:hypothetical protein